MKNVGNVNFWQIDHKIKKIAEKKGVVVLSSPEAWQKFKWSRAYFSMRPEEGYFIWVREKINFPCFSCVSIASKNIEQKLRNLLVIEKDLSCTFHGTCNVLKKNLSSRHLAKGKIILKENAVLNYEHIHSWGEKDVVEPDYEFILEKNSKLNYTYKNLFTPKEMKIKTTFNLFSEAVSNIKIIANCRKTKFNLEDVVNLKGKGASGQVKLRLVGREDSKISAVSQMTAEAESRGHLDCQGLLAKTTSEISLIPGLVCKNKKAQMTHEASIGKIAEDQLTYLRQRGIKEEEAINLIINGFLEA